MVLQILSRVVISFFLSPLPDVVFFFFFSDVVLHCLQSTQFWVAGSHPSWCLPFLTLQPALFCCLPSVHISLSPCQHIQILTCSSTK